VILVHGSREDAQALREDVARTLAPMGLRLSPDKTQVVHMSDGFNFLGFRIRWKRKRGTNKWYVYTFIADRPVRSLKVKIRALTHKILMPLVWRSRVGETGACRPLTSSVLGAG
jgi:RNA-directed DNA polymerase